MSAALLLPATLEAQWVEPPGRGWASLTVYHQDTRESFDRTGTQGDFPGDGHAVATQSFLTVAWGWLAGFDGWAQLSFQRLRFDDLTGRSTSVGPGDMRFYARVSPVAFGGPDVPVALRGGVKLPVGDFDVGSSVIPLGDGQRDWELMLELGRSFYPAPLYVMAWAGYRWREARDSRTDFGDERFFYAALGGTVSRIGYKGAIEGWYGSTPTFNAVRAEGAEREMLRTALSLLIPVGPGEIELGGRLPLSGRNLPAGPDLLVGYFVRLGGG